VPAPSTQSFPGLAQQGGRVRLWVVLVLLVSAGMAGWLWRVKHRLDRLDEQLRVSAEQAEQLNQQLESALREFELAVQRAREASIEASRAR